MKLYHVITAMHAYRLNHSCSDAETARQLGITPQHFNKIMKHTTKYVSSETWDKIKDKIEPYMPQPQHGNAELTPVSDLKAVPLLTMAQAKEIDGTCKAINLEPGDKAHFMNPGPDDFAVMIKGNSMEPWYPHGSRVLVGRQLPQHRDRVVVNIPDQDELLFKVYLDLGGKFALWSINQLEGVKPMVFDKMQKGETWHWVYPIRESIRDERDIDLAMAKHAVHHNYESWVSEYKKENK